MTRPGRSDIIISDITLIYVLNEMKYTTLTLRSVLLDKKIRIFNAREFGVLFDLSPRASVYYLEKSIDEGLCIRLKRGLYSLKTDPPHEQEIANQLYRPSYLSFEYALAFYNILPEMVYTVTSATTKPTREFGIGQKTYAYTTIKKAAYTGYELKMVGERRFFIAEPEKALVDYLYLVSLGRRPFHDRIDVAKLDTKKMYGYVNLFGRSSVTTLIQKLTQKN